MPVAFSTVVRRVPHEEGGEVLLVDWPGERIMARRPMVPRDPDVLDLNPRGGARGGRGLLRRPDGLIVAATYHTLLLLDSETLEERGRITHPLFVGLHEMCFDGSNENHATRNDEHDEAKSPRSSPLPERVGADTRDSGGRIWIAATAIDAAHCVDLERGEIVESIWPREISTLRRLLELQPLAIDRSADNRLLWLDTKHNDDPSHTHLNAVCVIEGEVHILLNRFGVVWNATRDRVVIHDRRIEGAHNLRGWRDWLLINDTRGRAVHFYDRRSGTRQRSIGLLDYEPIRALFDAAGEADPKARSLFVRGLEIIDGRRALIGFSPASIAEFDLETGSLLNLRQFSNRVRECVHGLAAV